MDRSAPRLARLLACAAVPVMLIAGCSSGSDSAHKAAGSGGSGSPSAHSPAAAPVAAAKYATLPDPCKALTQDTVTGMVHQVKDAEGQVASGGDPKTRGGCSWTGLEGYQYRFLDDSFQRFDAVAGSSAAQQAKGAYQLAVQNAAKASGAKTAPAAGVGDEATLVTWDENKDSTDYHYATVIARTANTVVTVDFSGAGLQGDDKPKTDEMNQDTEDAAKQAVAAVAAANGKAAGGKSAASGSAAPSASAS